MDKDNKHPPDKTVKFPTNTDESKTSKYLAVVDDETGEVKGYFPLKSKHLSKGGDFLALYQDSIDYISNMPNMKLETLRVILKLFAKLDFDNYIRINQSKIAEEMMIKRPNVSRAIKNLLEMDIIREGPRTGTAKTYRLNPMIAHKGKHYDDTVIEFSQLQSKRRKKENIDPETGEVLD